MTLNETPTTKIRAMGATPELTEAEARALGRANLDGELRRGFARLAPEAVRGLQRRLLEEAKRRVLVYERDGVAEPIPVMARPVAVFSDAIAYLHHVSLTVVNALKPLPEWYLSDPAIRRLVPLGDAEDRWLRETWGPRHSENNPLISRLDAVADFTGPMWKESLKVLEANLSGIGGLHLVPICEQILADVVLPVMREVAPDVELTPGVDLRELFVQEILDHLQAIGRPGRTVCLLEPKYVAEGLVEQKMLAAHLGRQYGLQVVHADPSELRIERGEVCYQGTPVDVAYRDYEIRDLIALWESGVDISGVRKLFQENRVISSLAGEFDHKSSLEILTDPELARSRFSPDERQLFQRHVLWTRVLEDRRTALPDGEQGDLLPWVRRERERLVIKPNRAYGGEGVVIGYTASQSEWDGAIDLAARSGGSQFVVQRLARIPVTDFPVVAPDGSLHSEPFFVVLGFAPTKNGLAIMGRASQKMVVNIANRGGMCAVFAGRLTKPLHGASVL